MRHNEMIAPVKIPVETYRQAISEATVLPYGMMCNGLAGLAKMKPQVLLMQNTSV